MTEKTTLVIPLLSAALIGLAVWAARKKKATLAVVLGVLGGAGLYLEVTP